MLIHERHWFKHIAKVLTHFAAIFIENMSQAENALIRTLIKDESSDSHQGVKPSASLIDSLTDKVSRVGRLKFFD